MKFNEFLAIISPYTMQESSSIFLLNYLDFSLPSKLACYKK